MIYSRFTYFNLKGFLLHNFINNPVIACIIRMFARRQECCSYGSVIFSFH